MIIYTPLPNQRYHRNLFYSFKRKNEILGLCDIVKNDLYFDYKETIDKDFQNYFSVGLNLTKYQKIFLKDRKKFATFLEKIPKLSWLTKEFFENNKKFKYPVGVHYNLRQSKWNIHPGGSRQIILDYFGDDKNEFICFNNSNLEVIFKEKYKSIEEIERKYDTEIHFVCVADHGSLIPHLNFNQHYLNHNVLYWAEKINNYWNNTNIEANFDYEKYGLKNSNNKKNTVYIKIDQIDNDKKALLLAPLNTTYDIDRIEIKNDFA